MLKNCLGDPSYIVQTENFGIKESLSYEEILIKISYRQVRKLRIKEVASIKVFWRNQFVEKETWEVEEDMKKRYFHPFESREKINQGINFVLRTSLFHVSILLGFNCLRVFEIYIATLSLIKLLSFVD